MHRSVDDIVNSYKLEMFEMMERAQRSADIIFDRVINRNAVEGNLDKTIVENPIDGLTLLLLLDKAASRQLSKRQIEAAIEGVKKRASTEVKAEIKQLWEEWDNLPKAEKKACYKGQHEFALAMEDKFYDVENQKPRAAYSTIKNKWIPEWTREKVTQPVKL